MTLRAVISYRIWIYLIRYWACPARVDAGLPLTREITSFCSAVALPASTRQDEDRDWDVEAAGPVHGMPDDMPPNRLGAWRRRWSTP
jgi:hypothetical protein